MNKFFMLAVLLVLASCSQDEIAESNSASVDESLSPSNSEVLAVDTFLGSWSLSQLTADNEVDLNGDGISNSDLMVETDCFNTSGVVFNEDGSFIVTNRRLDFRSGASNDEFSCGSSNEFMGTWEVEEDNLILHFNINGMDFTQSKTVDLNENSFSFDVSKFESDQYVGDAQGTVMEDTEILSIEYTRV